MAGSGVLGKLSKYSSSVRVVGPELGHLGEFESPYQFGPLLLGWLPDLHQRRSALGEPALKGRAVEELR
jgi:hypothetical protein